MKTISLEAHVEGVRVPLDEDFILNGSELAAFARIHFDTDTLHDLSINEALVVLDGAWNRLARMKSQTGFEWREQVKAGTWLRLFMAACRHACPEYPHGRVCVS